MAGDFFRSVIPENEDEGDLPDIDTSVAHIARVYDYWLGGKDHFAADREVGDEVLEIHPETALSVRANRAFLARAVGYLTAQGIRQFLDIGTGLPTVDNTHEVAQAAAPASRVVYVDNDPIVLSHARALLTSGPEGATAYLDADVRDVDTVLARARELLDFGQPIGVLLIALLHMLGDEDDPWGLVARYMAAVPPGSYLVLSHLASDVQAETMAAMRRRINELMPQHVYMRTKDQVTAFFGGMPLVEPGVVLTHQWRPGTGAPGAGGVLWAGVARKP
jgi:S-adenosyl methyltransferase